MTPEQFEAIKADYQHALANTNDISQTNFTLDTIGDLIDEIGSLNEYLMVLSKAADNDGTVLNGCDGSTCPECGSESREDHEDNCLFLAACDEANRLVQFYGE